MIQFATTSVKSIVSRWAFRVLLQSRSCVHLSFWHNAGFCELNDCRDLAEFSHILIGDKLGHFHRMLRWCPTHGCHSFLDVVTWCTIHVVVFSTFVMLTLKWAHSVLWTMRHIAIAVPVLCLETQDVWRIERDGIHIARFSHIGAYLTSFGRVLIATAKLDWLLLSVSGRMTS